MNRMQITWPNKILSVVNGFIVVSALFQIATSIVHTRAIDQHFAIFNLSTIVLFAAIELYFVNQKVILFCALVAGVFWAKTLGNLANVLLGIYFLTMGYNLGHGFTTELYLRIIVILSALVPAYLLSYLVYRYKKENPSVRLMDKRLVYVIVGIVVLVLGVLGCYFIAGLNGIYPTPN